ncbi:DNA-directed RNA polymerase II [Coprinopsis cinerea okayama7|uniref:DNA-directed RNA polymerase II n=1 Tax=Coprinopsis cinerea (strain Okayama-7 / 130 / ATCC MYA-4618 / FGSC 9003) TaxID=240176 RepID=A8NBN7_COPC7|nr:DNA-directed RNA polymerase II [Coprinopsis cinerea okayama7\|eukprot:XP_001832235.1 DNA-directed RNA polymerase II [Coprinopsis cinerea okayama7\
MNAPARYELFVLEDGEKPVEVIEDSKIPNAATIKVVKQDHTLGNMLRSQLLAMPEVLFAGYKVPHPLHPYFIVKVQTDGSITPQAAVEAACTKLIATINTVAQKFKREFSYKDSTSGEGAQAGDDPYGGTGPSWTSQNYADFDL